MDQIPQVKLTALGELVKSHIQQIDGAYSGVYVDRWVIMPDHIHMILVLESSPADENQKKVSIQTVVRSLKTIVTKTVGTSIWQPSFYEHIIRSRESYENIAGYLLGNPGMTKKG